MKFCFTRYLEYFVFENIKPFGLKILERYPTSQHSPRVALVVMSPSIFILKSGAPSRKRVEHPSARRSKRTKYVYAWIVLEKKKKINYEFRFVRTNRSWFEIRRRSYRHANGTFANRAWRRRHRADDKSAFSHPFRPPKPSSQRTASRSSAALESHSHARTYTYLHTYYARVKFIVNTYYWP